jgi:hypothetical protein
MHLVEEPGESKSLSEEPEKLRKDKTIKEEQSEIGLQETETVRVITETQYNIKVKKKKEIEEKEAGEKRIEESENKEKRIEESENKEKASARNEKKITGKHQKVKSPQF